jgi:hypothetical protein
VSLHHVRPIKPSHPPSSQYPSATAKSSTSATNTKAASSKSSEMLPGARPSTAGKRRVHDLVSEMLPPPRQTTAGKSLRLISNISPDMQQATTAGKSLHLIRDPAAQRKPAPRPTRGGKSVCVIWRTLSEKDRQVLDASCSKLSFLIQN